MQSSLERTEARAGRDPRAERVAPRIVLIEDDDDIREALGELLESAGYTVTSYGRADEALAALEARPAADVILLDLMMPGMNGWQFRIEQKKRQGIHDIPVVVLTADISPYAEAIDADAYVSKPVDIDQLERVIERTLLTRERSRLNARAVELERVRSLGMLVATVAHEVNNPLTYVLGCLELARQDAHALIRMPVPDSGLVMRLASNVDAARDGAQRVASTVRVLSTFARADDDTHSALVNVGRAIDAALRLAQNAIEPRANLKLSIARVPPAQGNEGRLAQVVLNLLINAVQAIPEASPREHRIEVRCSQEAQTIVIEVEDNGAGMSQDVLARAFEPFFTTKPPGRGTGLGLSISRELIAQMGGELAAVSAPGVGSTFRITLPTAGDTLARESAPPEAPQPGVELPPVEVPLRVLVIDDEPLVVRFVQAALVHEQVEVVASPADMLTRAKEYTADLVLCDLRMPEMSGIALFHALNLVRPDLCAKFVLMTGASADAELESFVSSRGVRVLRKPFSLHALRELVSERRAQLDA